jgi:putative phage-type endonuclease
MERKRYKIENTNQWHILRATDVTSTDVSALFGISPYMSQFELWHRKKSGEPVQIEENERMRWGNRLESAIANGIGEDNGWAVKPFKDYVSVKELRIGSSCDYIAETPEGPAILEIKNVDSLVFKDGWITDGENLEAPPHIELQVQHQLLVSDIKLAYIGALVGGNKVILIKRKADEGIHKEILKKVAQLWDSIDKNRAPEPNFIKDAQFISSLYNYAEPGKVIEVDDDPDYEKLVETYKEAQDRAKEANDIKESIKAKLLTMIGDAEKVIGDGFTISAGVIGEAPIQYIRKSYRNFRISFKKNKEK